VNIAAALNFRPVSRIVIVVKAETRIDTVVDNVRKYADRFLELPMDVVGVLVTHMDMVTWGEKEFTRLIDDELGIDMIVFSWITADHQTLKKSILKTCTAIHNLTVDDENFFKLFKIHSNDQKILQSTSDEVKKFDDKKRAFDEAKKAFFGIDVIDLAFEFHVYMTDESVEAQKRMSKKNNFTFYGDGAANEAGHVANMVNQVRMILYDITTECLGYQSEHSVSELRKCPASFGPRWKAVTVTQPVEIYPALSTISGTHHLQSWASFCLWGKSPLLSLFFGLKRPRILTFLFELIIYFKFCCLEEFFFLGVG